MLRAAAVVAIAAMLVLAVSCFSKPGAPHANGGDDDDGGLPDDGRPDDGRMIDSPKADASLAGCGTHEYFTAATPVCGTWGAPFGQTGNVNRIGGRLEASPGMGSAGCYTTSSYSFTQGTVLEIVRAASNSTGENTFFTVQSAGGTTDSLTVNIMSMPAGQPMMNLSCFGATTGNAAPMAFDANHHWIKFVANGQNVTAWTGPDGVNFTQFGTLTCAWSNTAASVIAWFGVMSGSTTTVAAQFDNFNTTVCPPP